MHTSSLQRGSPTVRWKERRSTRGVVQCCTPAQHSTECRSTKLSAVSAGAARGGRFSSSPPRPSRRQTFSSCCESCCLQKVRGLCVCERDAQPYTVFNQENTHTAKVPMSIRLECGGRKLVASIQEVPLGCQPGDFKASSSALLWALFQWIFCESAVLTAASLLESNLYRRATHRKTKSNKHSHSQTRLRSIQRFQSTSRACFCTVGESRRTQRKASQTQGGHASSKSYLHHLFSCSAS